MRANSTGRRAGRHFLQIPGPTPVPDRIVRAMARPIIDHRGPEFQQFAQALLASLGSVFQTNGPVVIYASSATGAWEAALVNCFSAGDRLLMFETGHFAATWKALAERLSLAVDFIPSDWRRPADPALIEARLRADTAQAIKAVCVVHNETSTGVTSDIAAIRQAIDAAGHPALLMVDVVSSLGSIDYRHDAWGVDVTVAGSQKGLMLPPGLAFNAVSEKARAAAESADLRQSYWSWKDEIAANANGFFPHTPATGLLYGLDEAVRMLHEEGLEAVFARHKRHAAATRDAVAAWGLELNSLSPAHHSVSLTAVLVPEGEDADGLRNVALDRFDMSLGIGLGKLSGRAFRIGHLGDTNDLTILGALAGVEMSFGIAGITHRPGGVQAAMARLGQP